MNHRLAACALVLAGAFAPLALAASLGSAIGTITTVSGSALTLQTRTGAMLTIDPTKAQEDDLSVVLLVGEPVIVSGSLDQSGVLHATVIMRAKPQSPLWPADTIGPAAGVK
jgi:hypothetical protein